MLTDEEKDAVLAVLQTEMTFPEWNQMPEEIKKLLLSAMEKLKQ